MHKNIILTDSDDVLLDWTNDFVDWAVQCKGYSYQEPKRFDTAKWLGVTEQRAEELIHEYNSENSMVTPPYLDAEQGVKNLYANGFVFHVISAFSNDPLLREQRAQHLNDLFGNALWDITILPYGDSKEKVLSRYKNSGLYYIEDSIRHYQTGKRFGLKPLLMYNPAMTYDHLPMNEIEHKVESWEQIESIINE